MESEKYFESTKSVNIYNFRCPSKGKVTPTDCDVKRLCDARLEWKDEWTGGPTMGSLTLEPGSPTANSTTRSPTANSTTRSPTANSTTRSPTSNSTTGSPTANSTTRSRRQTRQQDHRRQNRQRDLLHWSRDEILRNDPAGSVVRSLTLESRLSVEACILNTRIVFIY